MLCVHWQTKGVFHGRAFQCDLRIDDFFLLNICVVKRTELHRGVTGDQYMTKECVNKTDQYQIQNLACKHIGETNLHLFYPAIYSTQYRHLRRTIHTRMYIGIHRNTHVLTHKRHTHSMCNLSLDAIYTVF